MPTILARLWSWRAERPVCRRRGVMDTSKTALPLSELYAPIRADMAVVERVFDEELVSCYPFIGTLCERVKSYRGKMLRPALLLLSGRAAGGITRGHHVLAAVVEMVHMATLVHDDVLDGAHERRGQTPVNVTEGNVAAVLLGDYLISHAFHLCSSLERQHASRRIGATTNIVCEGELLQNRHCGDATLTESDYFEIIRRKTGALTAVACELGAFQSGADESAVSALREFGMSAGVAFQIVDDVLDIVGDVRKVGKSLGLDLAMGKLTLPTIHCLAHASVPVANAVRAFVRGEAPIDGNQLRRWLKDSGSIDYALAVAAEHIVDAQRRLDLLPPGDARSSLAAMAEFVIRREF